MSIPHIQIQYSESHFQDDGSIVLVSTHNPLVHNIRRNIIQFSRQKPQHRAEDRYSRVLIQGFRRDRIIRMGLRQARLCLEEHHDTASAAANRELLLCLSVPLPLIRLSALHFNSSKRNENHLKRRHGRRNCE